MITQDTAAKIWQCYREIEVGNKLFDDLEKLVKEAKQDKTEAKLRDVFGNQRNLQLGVPSGENAHRLFDVHPDLALSIIRAHIAEKQAELVRLEEKAKVELLDF